MTGALVTRPLDEPAALALCGRLRQRRLVLGIRQNDLAARLGVRPSAVCNWEQGRHSPYLVLLTRWAAELGWEVEVGEPDLVEVEDEL